MGVNQQQLQSTGEGINAYSGLESGDLLVGEGVGLGNDRDQVDLGVQALHDLDIQRLQRVASRLDEENAGMNAVVDNVHAVNLVLRIKVGIEALFDVVDDRAPRLVIVDEVAKAGGVNHRQPQTHASLLDISADGLNRDSLGNDVEAGLLALFRRVQRRVEESVDQGRLSEAGFTC